MTERIEQTYRSHSSSHNSQQLSHKLIYLRLMFLVNNIDWFDFSHEHKFGKRFSTPGSPSPQRIPVIFTWWFCFISFNHNRDYLYMVQVEQPSILMHEILNHCSIIHISLKVLYVVLYVFGFVGNREIKNITSQTKIKWIYSVTKSDLSLHIGVHFPHYVVLAQGSKRQSSRSLYSHKCTLGRLIIPWTWHWKPSLRSRVSNFF